MMGLIRDKDEISIHAPLTGGDTLIYFFKEVNYISIHAPLTGGDYYLIRNIRRFRYFNPRPPHGRRQYCVI